MNAMDLTSSTGVPWLRSGPSPPMVCAIEAASSETCSIGFASSRFERSAAGGFVESDDRRNCDGVNPRADRAGHCTWRFGRKAIGRAKAAMFNLGGIMAGCVVGRVTFLQSDAEYSSPLSRYSSGPCILRQLQRCIPTSTPN